MVTCTVHLGNPGNLAAVRRAGRPLPGGSQRNATTGDGRSTE